MEIEISMRPVLPAAFVFALVFFGVLGYLNSPRVEGHPVLLTRDNLAVLRYLRAAERWEAELGKLPSLLFPEAVEVAPGGPGELYYRNRLAQEALDRVLRVKKEVETYPVPETMVGLHSLAVSATDGYLKLARVVVQSLSNPPAGKEAPKLKAGAEKALKAFSTALRKQQEAIR